MRLSSSLTLPTELYNGVGAFFLPSANSAASTVLGQYIISESSLSLYFTIATARKLGLATKQLNVADTDLIEFVFSRSSRDIINTKSLRYIPLAK